MDDVMATDRGIIPFVYFEDAAGALDWLCRAFGFSERFRLALPNGVVMHAELALGDAVLMIGNVGPRNAGPPPQRVRSGAYVFVEDVTAHHAAAVAAGAEILEGVEDQPYGDRTYMARDPEGHEWYFAQHVRDVPIAGLRRQLGGA